MSVWGDRVLRKLLTLISLARIAQRTRKDKTELAPNTSPKPKKKKAKKDKDFQKQTAASSIESDLRAQSLRSLLELIQTDPAASDVIQEDSQNGEFPVQNSRRKSRSSCDICKAKKTRVYMILYDFCTHHRLIILC